MNSTVDEHLFTNFSSTNVTLTLDEVNNDELKRQIPLLVYLCLVSVIGTVGNCLVFYIFKTQYGPSNCRIFVLCLSILDFIPCAVSIPAEIFAIVNQYTYVWAWPCKASIFLKTWPTLTSGLLLLCIGADRYRKVCKPLSWQITEKQAKIMCVAVSTICVAVSWISAVYYGVQISDVQIFGQGITIYQCTVLNNMKKTALPVLNNVIFGLLFIHVLVGISVLYSLIALRIRQHTKKRIEMDAMRKYSNQELNLMVLPKETNTSRNSLTSLQTISSVLTRSSSFTGNDVISKPAKRKRKSINERTNRTAFIMFLISLAFILSYLPIVCILLYRSSHPKFTVPSNDAGRTAYRFFIRSYFLNSAMNPIIYGLWDRRFRAACKDIVRKCIKCK